MRRTDREIRSRDEIDAIIRGSQVCRLAFAVDGDPYLVPVAFGYDGRRLYFHTAESGKKLDCIAANHRVCFEFERNVCLVEHPKKACKWSFTYESVIGIGMVHELISPEEKERGLRYIMRQYSNRDLEIDPAGLDGTRVWGVSISAISGKRAEPKPE